jgi:hypothetical protein
MLYGDSMEPSGQGLQIPYFLIQSLKVHKRDNFLGSDFEFCTFL